MVGIDLESFEDTKRLHSVGQRQESRKIMNPADQILRGHLLDALVLKATAPIGSPSSLRIGVPGCPAERGVS